VNVRRVIRFAILAAGAAVAAGGLAIVVQQKREGYTDTPILPGQKWHVHDPARPYPAEVDPGSVSGAAPSDAIVLFDGKDLSKWMQKRGPNGSPSDPKWKIEDGVLVVNPGTGDLFTREKFGDCQLHVEWMEPADIEGSGQGRGNSGVFLMSRYEVQVLDSYRAPTYADGQAAAIYGQWPPLVNPMRKPGQWQSYDIIFKAAKFDGGKLADPAYMTVLFNGVVVHDHQKLNGPTGHRVVQPYANQDTEDSIGLQDHGSTRPVRFRNIWVRRLLDYDQPEKP
jgi:Domain of Unknown Function (DUF1080)